MDTNVVSSAAETATQTAASTGGIGMTVFKLVVIAAVCGLVYVMLKKKRAAARALPGRLPRRYSAISAMR